MIMYTYIFFKVTVKKTHKTFRPILTKPYFRIDDQGGGTGIVMVGEGVCMCVRQKKKKKSLLTFEGLNHRFYTLY